MLTAIEAANILYCWRASRTTPRASKRGMPMGRTTVASDASRDPVFHDSFRANSRLARISRTKERLGAAEKTPLYPVKIQRHEECRDPSAPKIAREPKRTQATNRREQQQGNTFRCPEKS